MQKLNDKYLQSVFYTNKISFANYFMILSFCFFMYGVMLGYQSKYIACFFIFAYCLVYLYLAYLINKNVNESDFYFYISYIFIAAFYYLFLILSYYIGEELLNFKRFFYFSAAVLNVILSSRVFQSKYTFIGFTMLYSVNGYLLGLFIYFIYGSEQFWANFDLLDFIFITFMVLMNISNTLSKVLNLEDYNKSLWENDFLIEKFNSLFKNLITPIIKIDKISKVIEYNENFKTFLKKITSEENYNGFFNNNLADMNTFCFKTMSTIEYIDFYTELEYDSMKSSQASNGAIGFPENNSRHIEEIFLNSVDTNANKDIFFKQLFFPR